MERLKNIAFIDGQNLHLGTEKYGLKVDYARLRVYLKEKYQIVDAYYFLGYINEENQDLYNNLQKAGFIIIFKEHHHSLMALKKGNVDSDIIFEMLKQIIEDEKLDKILLVSGDGDYIKVVKYLIKKQKFLKILFPNKKFSSSLYKQLGSEFYDYFENIKTYISRK